jgi:hypothetical protein
MLFTKRACVDAALRHFVSPPSSERMPSTAGYTIALASSIIFLVKRASSERMSFERMMSLNLNRGSDRLVSCLHHCDECVVFYFIAV